MGLVRSFLLWNGISMLYALVLFCHSELMVNTYRIERITGWSEPRAAIDITIVLIYAGFSVLCYGLTKGTLRRSRGKFITCVLWIPYYYLFIRTFAASYPITDPQEQPLGGVGIVLIGVCLLFPFYIALINVFAGMRSGRAEEL